MNNFFFFFESFALKKTKPTIQNRHIGKNEQKKEKKKSFFVTAFRETRDGDDREHVKMWSKGSPESSSSGKV
jgi:hypothetical protein